MKIQNQQCVVGMICYHNAHRILSNLEKCTANANIMWVMDI